MCSPASFETAYVQRASPTEPIVVTWPSLDVVGVRAEDLARREVDEALERVQRRERRLEHVVRADHVDAHRPDRALSTVSTPAIAAAVDDVRRPARRARARASASRTSAAWKVKFGCVGELGAAERVAVEVVERDDLVRVDEPPRERRADEAGAAGDEDALAAQGHAASLAAPAPSSAGGGRGGRGGLRPGSGLPHRLDGCRHRERKQDEQRSAESLMPLHRPRGAGV